MADVQLVEISGTEGAQIINSTVEAQQPAQVVLAVPGVQGATGSNLPSSGTTHQVLFKQSNTNYDAGWKLITNDNVDGAAAIAGTKISPNFGSQTVQTTGVFSHALGSAGAPSITFTGNVNTGLYSPGADQVAISTSGTGRVFVAADGKVGVGTSSPGYMLDVAGAGRHFSSVADAASLYLSKTNSGTADQGGNKIYFTNAGPAATARASGTLIGAVQFQASQPTSGSLQNCGAIEVTADGTQSGIYTPTKLQFSTGSNSISGSNVIAMTIDSSGRLLVGTSASANNVRLAQNLALVTTGAGNLGGLSLTNYGSTGVGASSIIDFNRSNGSTDGSLTLVSSGGRLGGIAFRGADGSAFIDSAFIEAYVDGTPGANDMPGRLVFSITADGAASPTEAMRINNQRELLIGTTTRTANGGVLQISNGITFPGTQSACSDPNTLDDYEEGTFTPTIIGISTPGTGTYTTQVGRYTKIGNRVFYSITVTWTAHTGTGTMRISSLPFTAANIAGVAPASAVYVDNLTLPASTTCQANVVTNTTDINIVSVPVGGGAAASVTLDTAATISVAGDYIV